jgi:cation:H+ antiporter
MITAICLALIAGTILWLGAELLVAGAAKLGQASGIPQLIIGLTIVAFGTSGPELVVSIQAALQHEGGLILGNALGSNVANLGGILGLTALVHPLKVESSLIQKEIPTMVVATLATAAACLIWNPLPPPTGWILLGAITIYTITLGRKATTEAKNQTQLKKTLESQVPTGSIPRAILKTIAGLVILTWGSKLLIAQALTAATMLGVSNTTIGLTLVAAGTSLPELAVCLAGAIRKHADLAVGNLVGSSLFNLGAVLGAGALLTPVPTKEITPVDLLTLIILTSLCLPFMKSNFKVSRGEGATLAAIYLIYLTAKMSGG